MTFWSAAKRLRGAKLHAQGADRRGPAAPFALQPFVGDGLSPKFADASWQTLRDEIYRDRS
jgi:hypothetical protein